MLSKIFIDRPIFAWVIAIIIMLVGIGSITQLPVAQYPDVAPPQININATYPGASADTLQNSVTQILEQQLTGLDGMLYFNSSSSSAGSVTINVTFSKGTNPDIAQVQVQNKRSRQAISRLPQQVQQQGVRVTKSNPDFLLIVAVYDTTDRSTGVDVGDWLVNNMQYPLSACPASATSTSSARNMRCGSGSTRQAALFQLMPSDMITAILAQNTQVAAGEIGAACRSRRADARCDRNRPVAAPDARAVPQHHRQDRPVRRARAAVGDVARVELGAESYAATIRINGHPGSGIGDLALARRRRSQDRGPRQVDGRADRQEHARRLPNGVRLRHDGVHQAVDHRGGEDAGRGDGPRRHRDVRLPAELARDADPGDRHPGGAARHVRRALCASAFRSTR